MGARHRLGRPTEAARALRRDMTRHEKKLWRHLRGSQLEGYKFSRQLPIAGAICDFACRSARLVVEVDGGQHGTAVAANAARTRRIEAAGYRVIRFWNNEVDGNLEGVLATILDACTGRAPTPQPPPASGRGSRRAPRP